MVKKTSRLFFSLIGCILITYALPAAGQNKTKSQNQEIERPSLIDQSSIPLFNGIFIGYDLLGPAYKAYSDDYLTNEINIDFNLKNRYFPAFELGYGNADKWSDHGIHYKAKAPFLRIGADYNFLYKKHKKNLLTVGLRYGLTSFDYEVDNLALKDNTWGDQIDNPSIYDDIWNNSYPLNSKKLSSSMHWLEFVVGVRTSIYKNLYMGWSIRLKYRLSAKENEEGNPWYVPGYGIYKSSRLGLSYSIIYKIPGIKKRRK